MQLFKFAQAMATEAASVTPIMDSKSSRPTMPSD